MATSDEWIKFGLTIIGYILAIFIGFPVAFFLIVIFSGLSMQYLGLYDPNNPPSSMSVFILFGIFELLLLGAILCILYGLFLKVRSYLGDKKRHNELLKTIENARWKND